MLKRRTIYVGAMLLYFAMGIGNSFGQVNLQTGSATFSIPMFSWKDTKTSLNTGVSLNYNSGSGLRVNDLASDAGQGWNLDAGGVISRMQVGEPDDQQAYPGTPLYYGINSDKDITRYAAGFLYAPFPASAGCPNALTKYPIYPDQNTFYSNHNTTAEDRQMDYFTFQFNGKNGIFVLDTSGVGRMLGDSRMIIKFQKDLTMINQGIRTTITSFTIQDVDGLIYKFALHGLTKVLKVGFTDKDNNHGPFSQPNFANGGVYYQTGFDLGPSSAPWANKDMANPYIIDRWYLSEIDDPLTNQKIVFKYTPSATLYQTAGADIATFNSDNNYIIVSFKNSVTLVPQLDSIICPDAHVVKFHYGSLWRVDMPGEFPLSSVDITYQGRYFAEYQLNTTYFIKNRYGTPSSPFERTCARLCLKSVKKIGVDLKEDSPPYVFDYFTGSDIIDDIVPPPFTYDKDIWGYYNGMNNIDFNGSAILWQTPFAALNFYALKGLCFLNVSQSESQVILNPKSKYAQNGLLKEVIYPTGGSLSFQYGQNTATLPGGTADVSVGGVHVTQTSVSDGGYTNGCGNPLITHYNYVTSSGTSSLWGIETPVHSIQSNNSYAREDLHHPWSLTCPTTCCKWKFVYPGVLSKEESVSLSTLQTILVTLAPALGILSIAGDVMDVINICSSVTPLFVLAIVIDIITTVISFIAGCNNGSKFTQNTMFYNFDLNAGAPLPSQYKRVEIVENPGTIGKTIHEFTSSDDYALWATTNPLFTSKQRFAPWAYGLTKRITKVNSAGTVVKQTTNIFDMTHAQTQIGTAILENCKCQVNNNYSQNGDDWGRQSLYDQQPFQTTSNADMAVEFYYLYTGRVNLDTTYETVYGGSNPAQSVQTITAYSYNSVNNYEPNAITFRQSNGDVNTKYIKYSSDYSGGPFAALAANNIGSIPVATSSYIKKASGTVKLLAEKVTEFTTVANGQIRASRTLEQRFNQPIATNIYTYPGPATADYSHYKIPETYTYDANSNMTGVKDESGRLQTNIYDYYDKYIVATVINADPNTDKSAYTSFESQDFTRSGWVPNGAAQAGMTPDPFAPTGFFYCAFFPTASMTASGLNTTKPYTLSFWAANNNVTLSAGAGLAKTGPTIHGYTYYEYNVAQGTASITITNNATTNSKIDELRLYPAAARMKTHAFDPLIGRVSECDENNRITYFTYDNLSRLQYIEDENRNILKAYEYNTVSAAKQTGCPVTFSNHLVSETFTRNNCGAGYVGGDYTYSVPSGRYTSTFSQFLADMVADNDLLNNGQNAANANGACILLYYNAVQSQAFTSTGCAEGLIGGSVTYTVPARTYTSTISQADADQQALAEVTANGQAYANSPLHLACSVNTAPDFDWDTGDPSYCQSVGGALPPHLFVEDRDKNPNSPTYNQLKWEDAGPQAACPAGNYYNVTQSANFTRNNCPGGGTVTYTVAPGIYTSTVSQAAADQQATNDIAANGQNYANTNGTCCTPSFAYASGISSIVNQISLSGTTVNFTWVFNYPAGGVTNFQLGTVTSACCIPTSTRTIPFLIGTTTYSLTIASNGVVTVQIVSGPIPAGIVGFSGSYDLNLNAFYSVAESGSFTRNNCSAGQSGSTVTYSVAQYAYHSLISQADANQQAINGFNAGGQSYANSTGTCSTFTSCSFTWSASTFSHGATISSSGTTGSFNITLIPSTSGYTGGTLGTIVGGCAPSGLRSFPVTDGATPSRIWNVAITSGGVFSISLSSGSAATNSPPPIVLIGTYSL